MNVYERTATRRVQNQLYHLKRQYGGRVDIYKFHGSSVPDVSTGVKQIDKDVHVVQRAIVLPAKITRDVERTISAISANKQFVYGGYYDASMRTFIIDRRDTDVELTKDDWLVYRDHKYQFKRIEAIEFDAAWIITARDTGERPEQIFLVSADNLLDLRSDANES